MFPRDRRRVRVTRGYVEVGDRRTLALVALAIEAGRPTVIAVGDTREALGAHFSALQAAGKIAVLPDIVRPGDDVRWDRVWRAEFAQWRSTDDAPGSEGANTVLLIEPLRNASWSPAAAEVLLRYAAALARPGGLRLMRTRHSYQLVVDAEFGLDEYGDIVDGARRAFGWALQLASDRPDDRSAALVVAASASVPLRFACVLVALLTSIVITPVPPHRSPTVVGAASVAVLLWLLDRAVRRWVRYRPRVV